MVYFKTDRDPIVQGAELLKIQMREVIDEADNGKEGRLLAEATYVMDPSMGSVLGDPIIEVHHEHGLPEELLDQLKTRAEEEAESWAAA
jgi:hypothetical protein